ncbi:MAG: 16S rRNA (cytosine(1402)-N(4))-methyltransferase, partial [Chlamydiales bacterium]|nr:16S rRNA (cytosine(1402)-N(4))-methyltransferase [Chlamydiales bacterium]
SLEDRIVKQAFKEAAGKSFVDKNGVFRKSENSCANIISKKPIAPSKQELRLNPRSRSAKLRVIEKI